LGILLISYSKPLGEGILLGYDRHKKSNTLEMSEVSWGNIKNWSWELQVGAKMGGAISEIAGHSGH
jgi:hypothetical protein